MPNIEPLSKNDLEGFDDLCEAWERELGFFPTSVLTLARVPKMLRPLSEMGAAVFGPGAVSMELKTLISIISANAAGCRYCEAHNAAWARLNDVPEPKVADVWLFEESDRFDESERAALRFAQAASVVPNAVTPAHFEDLRTYWSDDHIAEMLAVVAMFGFYNRWNDTMATELEPEPLQATLELAPDFDPGKHAAEVKTSRPV